MSSRSKLIAGAVVIAVVAGGGAAVAALELSSSKAESVSTVRAPSDAGIGGYGLGGGRLGGRGLGGGLGPGRRTFPRRRFFGSGVGAAATYLGMPVSAVREELAGGRTLAALASARKKTTAGLEAAMLDAQKKALGALVASGRLTRAQEARIEAGLEARVRDAVERGHPPGLPGGPPGSEPPVSTT